MHLILQLGYISGYKGYIIMRLAISQMFPISQISGKVLIICDISTLMFTSTIILLLHFFH